MCVYIYTYTHVTCVHTYAYNYIYIYHLKILLKNYNAHLLPSQGIRKLTAKLIHLYAIHHR